MIRQYNQNHLKLAAQTPIGTVFISNLTWNKVFVPPAPKSVVLSEGLGGSGHAISILSHICPHFSSSLAQHHSSRRSTLFPAIRLFPPRVVAHIHFPPNKRHVVQKYNNKKTHSQKAPLSTSPAHPLRETRGATLEQALPNLSPALKGIFRMGKVKVRVFFARKTVPTKPSFCIRVASHISYNFPARLCTLVGANPKQTRFCWCPLLSTSFPTVKNAWKRMFAIILLWFVLSFTREPHRKGTLEAAGKGSSCFNVGVFFLFPVIYTHSFSCDAVTLSK